jgi:type III secretion system YscQ/HrcQ family protein
MGIQQYQPTGLLKMKREDVTLINSLLRFLPVSPFTKDFRQQLHQKLSPFLQADFDIWLENIEIMRPHDLKAKLPPCTSLVELGLPPKNHPLLLEIELSLAQQAVDRILGGQGLETDPERPLSDIEEGIFTFVLLKAIALCQENIGDEMGLQFQILDQSHTLDNLLPDWKDDEDLYVIGFRIFLDLQVGYMRLIIPNALLTESGFASPPTDGPAWERLKTRLLETFRLMGDTLFPMQVEAGRSELSLEDLDGLGNEDIILLETTQLQVNGEEISGAVTCTFGTGVRGYLKSDLQIGENGEFQVLVQDIIPLSPPEHTDGKHSIKNEHNNDEGGQPMEDQSNELEASSTPDENLNETKHLLEDVTVPMIVEMGRVGLTAMEIAQLRSGTIFELGRTPGAHVQLIVDSKHIGDGELVEIEGQLGVRVLSLHRGGSH